MKKIVLDANVVLTGAFDVTSLPSLFAHERDRLRLLMPTVGWQETRRVARSAALKTGVDPKATDQVLDLYRKALRIELVPNRSIEGATARKFDRHYEASARWEQADGVCTYNSRDYQLSLVRAISPLALLREIDFEAYALAIPNLDKDEGCFLVDFVWHSTAGFDRAWLIRDHNGLKFGIDQEGNWVWSEPAFRFEQRFPLKRDSGITLLATWKPGRTEIWQSEDGKAWRQSATSNVSLAAPAEVSFALGTPRNGWQISLHHCAGAPVFPTEKQRNTVLRDGTVDSIFASKASEDLVAGIFALDISDDMRLIRFKGTGGTRPEFAHRPSRTSSYEILRTICWPQLVPGFEYLTFTDEEQSQTFTIERSGAAQWGLTGR